MADYCLTVHGIYAWHFYFTQLDKNAYQKCLHFDLLRNVYRLTLLLVHKKVYNLIVFYPFDITRYYRYINGIRSSKAIQYIVM